MDGEKALVSLGISVNAAQVFSAFNPSIFTIRHFGADPNTVRDIRHGEVVATALVLGLGIFVAGMLDDSHAFLFAVVVCGVMVGVYEWALATRRTDVRKEEINAEAEAG